MTGAVEQGEKVIVFSCFEEPMNRLAEHFGGSAVVVTGGTPADKRQALVDRFQSDDSVRVFLANIIAGGIGTQPDGGDAGRLQRSRLGACESLAGRGPRVPHRSDAHGQRHLHGRQQHDRRLRADGARNRRAPWSARSSTARRSFRMIQATCSTNCSARCASCPQGSPIHRTAR